MSEQKESSSTREKNKVGTQAVKPKRVRKKNALELHNLGECGCSILDNPNNCVYQQFLDGWSFVPDVGNGQKRGEVFTPRWVVDKMIKDVGMFPTQIIDENNYENIDEEELLKAIESKVVEPAVGTGNYISTILWHKLQCAKTAATDNKGMLDEKRYHNLFVKAISSVYAFDIDCGNLETTYQRLYKTSSNINSESRVEYWMNVIEDSIEKSDETNLHNIEKIVRESLNIAENNWFKFTNSSDGVVATLYRQHTGKSLPQSFEEAVVKIVNSNLQLFNGIVEEDTISDDFICPGWKNVIWKWWNTDKVDETVAELSFEEVRLADQMLNGQIENLQQKIEQMKNNDMVNSDEGLFSTKVWKDKKTEIEYNKLVKQLNKLKKEFENK